MGIGTMSLVETRDIVTEDQAAWRRLWSSYCDFYGTALPPAVTESTWKRIVDPQSAFVGRIAELDGEIVGFSLSVIHECSWTIAPVCYLEDLYVKPDARGRGIGSALIEDIIRLSRQNAWARVYWNTEADNAAARRLYDRFCQADGFVRYRLYLD
jgi:GNAT superfamily N-acetyltransferase